MGLRGGNYDREVSSMAEFIDDLLLALSAFLTNRLLVLAIFQNQLVNILSTGDASPTPEVVSFMVKLFISHDAATARTLHTEPSHDLDFLPVSR